jgi:glycosyltransferase involved in cell wall biosynthesis
MLALGFAATAQRLCSDKRRCADSVILGGLMNEQAPIRGTLARNDERSGPERRVSDLLIIDDVMPCAFSPFRTIEYSHYLRVFNASLLSTEGWGPWGASRSFNEYRADLPADIAKSVFCVSQMPDMAARLAYVTFLGNLGHAWPFIAANQLPFILQLYPGGRFQIDDRQSDALLSTALASPLLRKIITTQTITRDYLINKHACPADKVALIYGGVFESRGDFDFHRDKKLFRRDKDTLDLCFVAHKYDGDLVSKGYSQFIAIVRKLQPQFPTARFHVVGGYETIDIDLGDLVSVVTFYGKRPSDFFPSFYAGMDMIVSVNRAFALLPGAFDGFPTGSCIEAGFHGVLNALTDPMCLNLEFTDGDDIILLHDDIGGDAARIAEILSSPDTLYAMAYRNAETFKRVFDTDAQLSARTRVILDELTHQQVVKVIKSRSALDTGLVPLSRMNMAQRIDYCSRHPVKVARAIARRAKRFMQI